MRKFILNEHQFQILREYITPPEIKDKVKEVEDGKKWLEYYIEKNGEYMYDITNGKEYLVQYLQALSQLIGKGYAVCAPLRKNGTYGAFYVKPYGSFRRKEGIYPQQEANAQPRKHIPNLYQRMMMKRGGKK